MFSITRGISRGKTKLALSLLKLSPSCLGTDQRPSGLSRQEEPPSCPRGSVDQLSGGSTGQSWRYGLLRHLQGRVILEQCVYPVVGLFFLLYIFFIYLDLYSLSGRIHAVAQPESLCPGAAPEAGGSQLGHSVLPDSAGSPRGVPHL